MCTDMAHPGIEYMMEDAPKLPAEHADSQDELDDDEYMDDDEPAPRRSKRTSAKRPIVTSPPGQPPAQRPRVDWSVRSTSIRSIRTFIRHFREDVDPATTRPRTASRIRRLA